MKEQPNWFPKVHRMPSEWVMPDSFPDLSEYDEIAIEDSKFELPAGKEHPHFICRVCEKVFDLDIPMRLPSVNLPEGFNVSGGEVVYSGTCPQCQD